jgi:ribose transport system substrate-binding protein
MKTLRSIFGGHARALGATAAAALFAGGLAAQAQVSQVTHDKGDIMLVTSVINATNPYMASWIEGAQAVANELGLPLEVIQSNGSSQQQLAGLQALAAQGKTIVLVTNPIAASDVPAMVNVVKQTGGYVVVWWNIPPGYEPSAVGDTVVAFGTYNGVTAGKCGAEALVKAMGDTGGIIALQGVLDSTVSQERYVGLLDTIKDHPGIEVLEMQPAMWDQATALQVTQQLISKYGDKITGVWTADDAMMLGAHEAMSKAGMLDKVHLSGEGAYPPTVDLMVEGGAEGPVVGSAFHRGYIAAATGLTIAYKAAVGEIDISKLTADQRHGQYAVGCVTPENAGQYQPNGGIPEGYVAKLLADPFMDLVGGPVVVPDVGQ